MQLKSSNLTKLYGFGILKNGLKFDFPFRESVLSFMPLCTEVYYVLGDSEDETDTEFQKFSFCKTEKSVWDTTIKGGQVISVETNKALSFLRRSIDLKHAWGIYLQADEVLHEDDYQVLAQDIERAEAEGYDAVSLQYLHFWQTHHHIAISKTWYPNEIRAIKLDSKIESWGDGQSFKNCQKILYSTARIFHYGHVREQEAYKNKVQFQTSFHHEAKDVKRKLKKGEKESKKHKTILFFGNHPKLMKDRILRMNDIWSLEEKEEIYIIGKKENYSSELVSRINAHKINWVKSRFEIPIKFRKSAVVTEPSWLDFLFRKTKVEMKMRSPFAHEWTKDFRLTLQLSEKLIGIKAD